MFRNLVFIKILILFVFMGFMLPAWGNADDPTRPPTVKNKILKPVVKTKKKSRPRPKVKSKAWVLNSTLVAPDRRTAVINNKVVSLGEKIDGSQVIDIQSGKVKLLAKGKTTVLEISKKDVKIKKRKDSHKPTRKNGQ